MKLTVRKKQRYNQDNPRESALLRTVKNQMFDNDDIKNDDVK